MGLLTRLIARITNPRRTMTVIDQVKWHCSSNCAPGVDEILEWRDWSSRQSTPDQKRIENFLRTQDLSGKRILHVGIGNSNFAEIFCRRAELVDGITIQKSEYDRGLQLQIVGYRVFLLNKYSSEVPAVLRRRYDFIVDNNPSSFACCRKHFFQMLQNYKDLLNPAGMILTDRVGLAHVTTDNDLRWGLTPEDWFAIGGVFSLTGEQLNEYVIGLRKPG